MTHEIAIEGTHFYINGEPTYKGREWQGCPVEGMLLNSRMIQAVFDDENPETRKLWAYPDTGEWDPDRNTDEFCAALPEYRNRGLLGVTVGLQGGGSIYSPEVYDNYINTAFTETGELKQAYFDRLLRIIEAADKIGMIVIVNYFYVKQARRIKEDKYIYQITERVTDWLLRTGHRNILVDVANESAPWWKYPVLEPENIPKLIEIVKGISLDGWTIPAGSSTGGGKQIPRGKWLETEDFSMPHGNGCTPEQLQQKLLDLKAQPEYKARPRPILINEDSIFVENLEMAVKEGASWGFYCQGYGSQYQDRMNWKEKDREKNYDQLSGYQTLPVNWSINTAVKRNFFDKVKEITGE
ncbi:MAG: hypothetical protein ACLFQ6_06110 [Candidatus Sumerlaeia bacterium]